MNRIHLPFWLLIVAVATAMAPALAQNICDDEKIAIQLNAPSGWDLNTASGKAQGLCIVAYPHGSSWADSPAAMYVNVSDRATKGNETLEKVIDSDIKRFQANARDLHMSSESDFQTSDNHRGAVRFFSGDTFGNFDAVAYIEEPEVVVILALNAKRRAAYDAALPAFRSVVKSYNLLTRPLLAAEIMSLAKAEKDLSEEKAYEPVLTNWLGPKLGSILDACTASLKDIADPFDFALRVTSKGTIQVWVTPDTTVSNCFKDQLSKERMPAPPYYPLHYTDQVEFIK